MSTFFSYRVDEKTRATRPYDEAEYLPTGTPHPSRLRQSSSGFRNDRVLCRELRPLGKKPRHITREENLVVVLMLVRSISLRRMKSEPGAVLSRRERLGEVLDLLDVRIDAPRAKLSNRTKSPDFESFVETSSLKGSILVLFLHQTGMSRELTLPKRLSNQFPFSGLIDGTTIAPVLAGRGNNSKK